VCVDTVEEKVSDLIVLVMEVELLFVFVIEVFIEFVNGGVFVFEVWVFELEL